MTKLLIVLVVLALPALALGVIPDCPVPLIHEEILPDRPYTPLWVGPGDTLYAYYNHHVGDTQWILKSADHGETWDLVHEFPSASTCRGLFVDSRGTIFACFPTPGENPYYGKLQMGRFDGEGSRVWSEPMEFQCGYGFWKMCEDLQGNLFIGEYTSEYEDPCAAVIWRSTDGGESWGKVYEEPGRHVHFVACDPYSDTGSLYAAIGDGPQYAKLLRSDDQGENWVETLTGSGYLLHRQPISVVFTPTHRIYGSDWGTGYPGRWNCVYRTDDDVTLYDTLILREGENAYVWSMTRDELGIIFAGTVAREDLAGRPAIYMSLNGGVYWCKAKVPSDSLSVEAWKGVTWMSNFDSEGWAYYHDSRGYETYRFRANVPSWIPGETDKAASLSTPSPNPTVGRASLEFHLPSGGQASLTVYNISGRLVRRIAGGPFAPGTHRATWDGMDTTGSRVASGVYFVRLEVAGHSSGRKLLLVK